MGEEKTRVSWPEQDGEYKFVQLIVDTGERLVFGPPESTHGEILEGYLEAERIPFQVNPSHVPEKKGERYEVVGAGLAEIRRQKQDLTYGGESIGYNIRPDKKHLEKVLGQEPGWAIRFVQL